MTHSKPTVRFYLMPERHEPIPGTLGTLIRILGLDVYETSGLGRRALLEMKFSAILLLVVFFFDLGAWTLLFNAILNSKILILTPLTCLAIGIALLISITVLIYERQFLTMDTSHGLVRLLLPMSIRITVIVLAAIITAQPVELLFFNEPIYKRIHEEGIRREMAARWGVFTEWESLQLEITGRLKENKNSSPVYLHYSNNFKQVTSNSQELKNKHMAIQKRKLEIVSEKKSKHILAKKIKGDLESCRRKKAAANKKAKRLEIIFVRATQEVERAKGSVGFTELYLKRLEGIEKEAKEDYEDALKDLAKTQSELSRQQGKIRRTKEKLDQLTEEFRKLTEVDEPLNKEALKLAKKDVKEVQIDIEEHESELEARIIEITKTRTLAKARLIDWHRQLRNVTNTRSTITESAPDQTRGLGPRFVYVPPEYDFFQKMRVLKDLRTGASPKWGGLNIEVKEYIKKEFGLGDENTTETNQKQIFQSSWLTVYGIALIIPMLIIAMKLLMADELKAYYSHRFQAQAKNRDALTYITLKKNHDSMS